VTADATLEVSDAEPAKRRRPSGVNLPSGYKQDKGGFYIEPRWLVNALLDVEAFEGGIHDPFCDSGNVVGAWINILEGQRRRLLFDQPPPARVLVSNRRASIQLRSAPAARADHRIQSEQLATLFLLTGGLLNA
jgi:hypothetical protein